MYNQKNSGKKMKVGIIGGGNLGSSLAKGLLKSSLLMPLEITLCDKDEQKIKRLAEFGLNITTDNRDLVGENEVVFIAVKPDDVESILEEVRDISEGKLFVSVAAGVSIKFVEARIRARVIRTMPNICVSVAEMASSFSLGTNATLEDERLIESMLSGLGATFKVDEELLEAVTGLSGSGPAFFYQFIKAMRDAGVELGLSEDIALKLAAQSAKGAGALVMKSGENIDELTRQVCTPKGTTIEGIKILEDRKVTDAIKYAVKVATKRAKELSR